MEDINKVLLNLKVPTNQISQEKIQEVLITIKKCSKSCQEYPVLWNAITQLIWHHLESGIKHFDDQLLCATCFYSVLNLVEQETYLKKILDLIREEMHLKKQYSKRNTRTSQTAVSLIYGIFQSSFLMQANESKDIIDILQASFELLCLMAYEYSKFTFIVFKSMSLFKKVSKTSHLQHLFTKENQQKLLNVINHNWENPITGVRDLNKTIFQTTISTVDIVEYRRILQEINCFYWNKAKYLMLAEIVAHPNYIDLSRTTISDDWLNGLLNSLYKPGLVSAGADMYSAILKKIKSQDVWCEIFKKSIVNLLNSAPKKAVENFSNYWCLTTFKTFPRLCIIILDDLKQIEDSEQKLYSCLNVMKQANKLSLLGKSCNSFNYNDVEKTVLDSLVHSNNQLRMMAFEIVCSFQNEAMTTSVNYKLVLNFLQDNVNSDCTVLRISMLNSYTCFLSQIHISYLNNLENCHESEALKSFCHEFQDFIIKGLQMNGNYQRKITCIKLAHTFLNCIKEVPRKKQNQTKVCNKSIIQMLKYEAVHWMMGKENVMMSFVRHLKDPAEDIRQNTVNILLDHYSTEIRQTNMLNILIEDALKSMSSKFFYDISCGQSIFMLINNLLLQGDQFQALFKNVDNVFNFAHNELISEYKLNRGVVESINIGKQLHSYMGILQGALEVCLQKQYEINIKNGSAIELLVILEGISSQFAWEQETSTSSDFSKMSDMVQDIILKSGHDPSNESDQAKTSGLEKIVLMCLWLNVKASCDLSSLLIRYQKHDTQIDICQKALNIISHVLETCRHKGAIEAAGAALGKSILHLTSLPEGLEISKLPSLFLKNKLDELISEANKMASVTRRGAGLSIMVHRIVSSDSRRGKPLFHYFMKTMLETCHNTEDVPNLPDKGEEIDNEKDLPKAIYIHFLTRIVTDSSLASDVMFYSAELAELAFSNLTKPHWQIRNAALQLYGALIQKLIGQKKASGENEDTVATIACDELRTHSPGLWAYTLNKLQTRNCEDKMQYHSNLVPILNMLASLAPRYNFSNDTDSQIHVDKDLLVNLMLLLGSPVYSVRRLTAQSLYNIYPFASVISFLEKNKCNTENYLHGMLLLVAKYSKLRFTSDFYKRRFEDFRKKYDYILTGKHSYLCKEIFEEIFYDGETNFVVNLNKTLMEINENKHVPGIYSWANRRFQRCINNVTWDKFPQVLTIVLNCKESETYCGFFVEKIEMSTNIPETIMSEIVTKLLQFQNKFKSGVLWKMLYLISLKIDQEWLKTQCFDIVDVYKILEENQVSYKFRYIIPFAARLTAASGDENNLLKITKIIESLTNPNFIDVEMRYIATVANNEIATNLKNFSENVKAIAIKNAVIFLQDEDEDIRMLSTDFYPKVVNSQQTLQPYVCLFKILTRTFLSTVLTKTGINILKDKLSSYLLRILTYKSIDDYNPFANESNNIYLEINVLKELIENLK